MMKQTLKVLAVTTVLSMTAVSAHAALSVPAGNSQVVYDSDLNVNWTRDFNLFSTQANSYAGGTAAFVTAVINASGGVINDSPNSLDTVANSGVYNLSAGDFDTTSGKMNWWGAKAWVNYLNSTSYAGLTNWTLPQITPVNGISFLPAASFNGSTDRGFNTNAVNATSSQLAYLYYNELGNLALYDTAGKTQTGWGLVNTGPLTGIQAGAYWFNPDYDGGTLLNTPGDSRMAALFMETNGAQGFGFKNAFYYSTAVAAVPEPETWAMFLAGLGILGAIGRRRKATA